MPTLSAGPTYFSLLHVVQTDSGAHRVSCQIGTGGCFPSWVIVGMAYLSCQTNEYGFPIMRPLYALGVKNKKFWEELIAYFALIRHGHHIKQRVQQLFVSCIRCRGNVYTELLSSNGRRDTHTDTQTDGMDLRSPPSRWAQVPWYIYTVELGYNVIKGT
jgi:hypothetical protein